jgi:hypothetical protein
MIAIGICEFAILNHPIMITSSIVWQSCMSPQPPHIIILNEKIYGKCVKKKKSGYGVINH